MRKDQSFWLDTTLAQKPHRKGWGGGDGRGEEGVGDGPIKSRLLATLILESDVPVRGTSFALCVLISICMFQFSPAF